MDKRSPVRKAWLGAIVVLALKLVVSQRGSFGLVFTVGDRLPCHMLSARTAPRRAVAEEVEEAVDISEEAAEDAENFEVMYPVYSRTDKSMNIRRNTTWWPLTKTASSILSKEGEVEMDCLGAKSVYNAIEVARLLNEWISGTFRRPRRRNSAASGPAVRSSHSSHADAFTRGSRGIAGGGSGGSESGPGRGELFEGTQ